ncbi:hypothetical protein [Paenibacillus sp. YYML68]|uniref:hypothetical protein n=1 Tax=Paenibacillus sp. YYML68 TaxID=2909250 RepID=UPI002492D69E|nr:hypothetical protein [Paenibacillus sp. YYML68]
MLVDIGTSLVKYGKGLSAVRLKKQSIWLSKAPDCVKEGFPEIYGYGWNGEEAWLCMKKLKMRTLSEAIIMQEIEGDDAVRVVDNVLGWLYRNMYVIQQKTSRPHINLLVSQTQLRAEMIVESNNQQLTN